MLKAELVQRNEHLEAKVDIYRDMNDQLYDEIDILKEKNDIERDEIKNLKTLIDVLKSNLDFEKERNEHSEDEYKRLNKMYPEDPNYDWENEERFKETIALFDNLWHGDDRHSDGCGKCEGYQEILLNAFNKVESMSGRRLDEFTTFRRDTIEDNAYKVDELDWKLEESKKVIQKLTRPWYKKLWSKIKYPKISVKVNLSK